MAFCSVITYFELLCNSITTTKLSSSTFQDNDVMLIIVKWLVFYVALPMGFVMNFINVDCITRNIPNCDEHLDDISYFNDDDTNIYNFLKLTYYLILWLRMSFWAFRYMENLEN
jgi:hypothetical protein